MEKENVEDYKTKKVGRHWPLPSVTATLLLVPLEKSHTTPLRRTNQNRNVAPWMKTGAPPEKEKQKSQRKTTSGCTTTIQKVCGIIVRQSWNDPPADSFTVQRVCTPQGLPLEASFRCNFLVSAGPHGSASLQMSNVFCHPKKYPWQKITPKFGTQKFQPPSAVEVEVGTTSGTSGPGCSISGSTGSSHLYCLDFWIQPVISVDSLVFLRIRTKQKLD